MNYSSPSSFPISFIVSTIALLYTAPFVTNSITITWFNIKIQVQFAQRIDLFQVMPRIKPAISVTVIWMSVYCEVQTRVLNIYYINPRYFRVSWFKRFSTYCKICDVKRSLRRVVIRVPIFLLQYHFNISQYSHLSLFYSYQKDKSLDYGNVLIMRCFFKKMQSFVLHHFCRLIS